MSRHRPYFTDVLIAVNAIKYPQCPHPWQEFNEGLHTEGNVTCRVCGKELWHAAPDDHITTLYKLHNAPATKVFQPLWIRSTQRGAL